MEMVDVKVNGQSALWEWSGGDYWSTAHNVKLSPVALVSQISQKHPEVLTFANCSVGLWSLAFV